ncbi:hypothetical protein [Sporosarcina sp. G11-34]|uniref:hypothetical protein n=1 Tax=Sporosarcina sp. G11-34 TaxID=2849605 RepID=UPI0022A8D50B|nr:hypothetical protein [Sporosarcina sp. G11-34]MCZ2257572.1 hypothetical protein [Sporosarcina sp. G11-34]
MKKILVSLSAFIVLLLGASSWFFLSTKTTVVYEHENYDISLRTPSYLQVRFTNERERKMENTVDRIREFDVTFFGKSSGTYSIVERTLGNQTTFLFERMENDGRKKFEVETTFSFKDGADLETKSWNPAVIEHAYHNTFGLDPTVNPFGRVTGNSLNMIVGHVFVSKKMEKQYENGKVSRIRQLSEELRDVTVAEGQVFKSYEIDGGEVAESWLLLSAQDLFPSEQIENDYIDFALTNQMSQLNWLTMDGPFTKLAFSIEPSTEMGYGRVIGRTQDDFALDWHRKSESVFFETMVLNSRANLLYYIDEFEGTRWPTEYTSTWLGNAYGVRAPYVDTRYNEYVAFFLDQTVREFADDVTDAELYVPLYADYLLSRVETGEIIEVNDGYLIVDYFDEDAETPVTHASLNHELGGLKILLTAFQDTGDVKYMDVALKVIAGIESFGQADGGWIRDNGDLWYQARPDGTFSGDDYPQLTLFDLLETQKLLEQLKLQRNVYFDEMIDAKLAYLDNEDVELIEKVRGLLE